MARSIYTNDQFDKFRDSVLDRKIARHPISLAGIEIVSESVAKYGGIHFKLDKPAFSSLIRVLGISKGLRNTLLKTHGINFVDKFIASIAKKLEGSKAEVIMMIDTKNKTILNFLQSEDHMLSNTSYFKEVESVIDKYGLSITRMDSQENGAFSVSTLAPNSEWGLQGLKDEVFNFGLNFSNDPIKGTQVGTYNERLICTNGMTTMDMLGSCRLSNTVESRTHFFHSLSILDKQAFRPTDFGSTVKHTMNVQASVAELEHSRNIIKASSTLDDQSLELYLPYEETVDAYKQESLDINFFNKEKKKNAPSAVSYWELINHLTYISSNVTGIGLKNPAKLQMHAGKLLSKTPDTSNLVVSPF